MVGRVRVNEITAPDGLSPPTAPYGVKFSNNVSTDSTTLDWYQEGLITPAIVGQTSAGVGTYNSRSGWYTRVGRAVTFNLYCDWSAHTGTGNMLISGIPFASSSDYGSFNVMGQNFPFTGTYCTGYYRSSHGMIEIWGCGTAGWVQVPMDSVATIFVSGTMQIWGV